eukprot:1438196-Rhodomonas_salina.3
MAHPGKRDAKPVNTLESLDTLCTTFHGDGPGTCFQVLALGFGKALEGSPADLSSSARADSLASCSCSGKMSGKRGHWQNVPRLKALGGAC